MPEISTGHHPTTPNPQPEQQPMGQPTIEQNAAKLAEDIAGAFAADVHAAFRELLTPILALSLIHI